MRSCRVFRQTQTYPDVQFPTYRSTSQQQGKSIQEVCILKINPRKLCSITPVNSRVWKQQTWNYVMMGCYTTGTLRCQTWQLKFIIHANFHMMFRKFHDFYMCLIYPARRGHSSMIFPAEPPVQGFSNQPRLMNTESIRYILYIGKPTATSTYQPWSLPNLETLTVSKMDPSLW